MAVALLSSSVHFKSIHYSHERSHDMSIFFTNQNALKWSPRVQTWNSPVSSQYPQQNLLNSPSVVSAGEWWNFGMINAKGKSDAPSLWLLPRCHVTAKLHSLDGPMLYWQSTVCFRLSPWHLPVSPAQELRISDCAVACCPCRNYPLFEHDQVTRTIAWPTDWHIIYSVRWKRHPLFFGSKNYGVKHPGPHCHVKCLISFPRIARVARFFTTAMAPVWCRPSGPSFLLA